ncbi:MAG: hypothetical protein NXI01_06075 [Gammaproteobacteria bacterium]|nr:hypothetical protein [Gammaproteobacteria bacterium]
MMRSFLIGLGFIFVILSPVLAKSTDVAAPMACISADFTAKGDQYWKTMTLRVTNHCEKDIDFQNATITFQTSNALKTTFWGEFAPLPHPDKSLNISSQKQADDSYLASLTLHFPVDYGTTVLPAGKSFKIMYGSNTDGHVAGSTRVYLQPVPSVDSDSQQDDLRTQSISK